MPVIPGIRWSVTISATGSSRSASSAEHVERLGPRRGPHDPVVVAVPRRRSRVIASATSGSSSTVTNRRSAHAGAPPERPGPRRPSASLRSDYPAGARVRDPVCRGRALCRDCGPRSPQPTGGADAVVGRGGHRTHSGPDRGTRPSATTGGGWPRWPPSWCSAPSSSTRPGGPSRVPTTTPRRTSRRSTRRASATASRVPPTSASRSRGSRSRRR